MPAALFTDATGIVEATQPLIMNGGGQAQVFGKGSYKLTLQYPGDSNCPGTGAVVWTIDGVFILTSTPTFTSVTAGVFNCTATGGASCIQQQNGTFEITGGGDAAFQTVEANTTFNSLATGTTAAFQTQTGNFEILGNGTFQGQQGFTNQIKVQGYAGPPSSNGCTACSAPGSGYGLIAYDTNLGMIRFNLGNAGWISPPVVPGGTGDIILNSSGALAIDANLTYSAGVLNAGVSNQPTTGFEGPVFNSTNDQSNNPNNSAFQTADGGFYVKGSGALGAQTGTFNAIGTGTGANTDMAGIVTLSGGTVTIGWPSGHVYTSNPFCVANDFTANHSVSIGATTTGFTANGTSSDQVVYFCAFTQY